MKDDATPLLKGRTVRHIHAVGVGGMGLGPLAIYLARRGWTVSGEDDHLNPGMAAQLTRAGVELESSGKLPAETDLLVYSAAISPEHATRQAARTAEIPSMRRGELLAAVARERRLVGVCGSHGKTTVTAMLVSALRTAGWDVSYVLGGLWGNDAWAPAAVGESEWLVAEIDESDGTIAHFAPAFTLVVNLDWDHADHYTEQRTLEAAFAGLMARTTEVVMGSDACATTMRLFASKPSSARMVTFGRTGEFQMIEATVQGGSLELAWAGAFAISAQTVAARGEFNALNASGAVAAAQLMGAPLNANLLADFPGVRRRQTVLRHGHDLTVIEDYAHHPAEIRALLHSLRRDLVEGERLVVVFQPHRFSRTRQFKAEFAAALGVADSLHLLDVYAAGEAPLTGGTTADLYAELMRLSPRLPVNYLPGDAAGVLELLRQSRRPGDCVVFVGAGDIELRAREWLAVLDDEAARVEQWDQLAAELRAVVSAAGKVAREEPLANKTTLRVGGAARVYVEPADAAELQEVVRRVHARGLPLRMLGRGSNLLVPDAGVDGVVVSLRRAGWETFTPLEDGRVRVGAGLRLKNLCGLAAKAGLQGFEFLEGIPGNLGGALRMNAGAMGGWMFDVVDALELLTLAGERMTLRRDELHVGYRHCRELEQAIAIGAVLRPATVSEATKISRQIDVYRSKRQESQPREPSAGCIFKNPGDDSAGRLIDMCGLKGERIGDAEVSTVHGNFIINRGHATSAEVIELVRRVRAEVQRQTGTELQPEVLLYGSEWEDVL
ncbi:UDP-N-acetylmuramate dehydrogenase [Synoicihabitans lomoniglobus]|uniref:UDP-N-acetylenolpyruvoylglucosamine reductase n=1 Tax=Synoicihabitans lomoniglobus TaxID=2909285 RepID=A0AAF0CQF5_9BACT|nr:UDP-N-acetylmuramate dehydrogenase [Opitutaceae bacterium LMO-M01]WED66158.1 UDP-N-acetylmuramate dehydrogenase [Opitutaceae bacterium LMO-M01]